MDVISLHVVRQRNTAATVNLLTSLLLWHDADKAECAMQDFGQGLRRWLLVLLNASR